MSDETGGRREAGLQAERTVLAHWRTQLATVVVSALVVRQSTPGAERVLVSLSAALAVGLAGALGFRRERQLTAGRTAASPGTALALVVAVVALQLGALAVVI